jgi:antitoxin MazE
VREEAGRIVIESVQEPQYDLADLVKRINSKNRHGEIDFGEPVGKEVW